MRKANNVYNNQVIAAQFNYALVFTKNTQTSNFPAITAIPAIVGKIELNDYYHLLYNTRKFDN